jgi:hypothetical protein
MDTRIQRSLMIAVLSLFAAGTLACDEKKKEPETSVQQKSTADKFADNLVSTEFVMYAVGIGGGGRLVYQTLDFDANGTWTGDAELLLAEDPFDCTESGTWQLENEGPSDPNLGRVNMVMDSTDCPGREAPGKWKIEVRLQGKGGRPEIIDL